MTRWREFVACLHPAAKLLIAIGLGGLAALSMPPVYLIPVLLPSLIGLYWLTQASSRPRAAFFVGWAFGAGYFLVGLYWIGNAFMVHALRHAWLAVPAVVGLSVCLGLFMAIVCWAHRYVFRRCNAGLGGVLAFAVLWSASEWVRSWLFTGFPWNLIGSAWAFSDTLIQPAAYLGSYGLGTVTVIVFCAPAVMGEAASGAALARWRPLLVSIGIVAVMWSGGALRLSGAELTAVPGVLLRLVQPNIPQDKKWKSNLKSGHVLNQLDMSLNASTDTESTIAEKPTHVIWAETAVPYILSHDPSLIQVLTRAVPDDGALITGSLRSRVVPESGGKPAFWNSLFAIDPGGDVLASYDKVHLVPFGEYVPLKKYLPIEKLTAGAGQFTPGAERQSIVLPGLPPFSPLICYEVIFPGAVLSSGPRPMWLLNLTNDAWYGLSSGPYQHFVAARLRAVEEGLPVVRVANTGISGVIDGYGRALHTLELGKAGVLDAQLPQALATTVYGRYHNLSPLVLGVVLFGVGVLLYRRRRGEQGHRT